MSFLENLKLDSWWGITLYLGVLSCIGAVFLKVDFLNEKHLFGLGIGLILIGISHVIAYRHRSEFKPANAYTGGAGLLQWREIRHSMSTIILFILGLLISLPFGILIVIGLLK